jgi:membrane associated rhomboid family serine protease
MPLYDRDYMREPDRSGYSLTIKLIILLITLFFVQASVSFYGGMSAYTWISEWLALSLDGIKQGRVWQLFTFQFLHQVPWPWHVLLNCLGLYYFGRSVEETLGSRRFLMLYLACGFCGGLLHLLSAWILPHHDSIDVVGASAGISGLLAAFCFMYPMREITFIFFFFPVTLRAQYLLWFVFGMSVFGTIIPFDNTAYAAHLGGMLMGLWYVRYGMGTTSILSAWNPFKRRNRREKMIRAATSRPSRGLRVMEPDPSELPSGEFMSQEVDPILEKISAHGIQSLTERERQILQSARDKMSKR